MAIEPTPSPPLQPTPETLLRLQTQINVVKAQHTDLLTKVRQRRLVEVDAAEDVTIARARRVRDQLLTAPARHAALIAGRHGLAAASLNAALVRFVHETLRTIAAGPVQASSDEGEGVANP